METAKESDILRTPKQMHQQDLGHLKSLRYVDDDFMAVCPADNFEGLEQIIKELETEIMQLA